MAQFKAPAKKVVLVVDDEPLLRMLAVDVVEEAGFEAIEARTADEAIEILEARNDIRIVFTDVYMPGSMNGLMLAAAVRDRWPPIEIIITFSLGKFDIGLFPANSEFFPKPYDTVRVTAALRRMAAN